VSAYAALKESAWRCNMELPRLGLVAHTFGNASVCDREQGVVAIKPSGVAYDVLRPEDMVVLDLQNTVLEGTLRPSSDTKTHIHLYRNFPEIRGIVHTHSTYAVAWAQARIPVPLFGTTHADFLPTAIPCTPMMTDAEIAGDYEEETGALIVRTFARLSPRDIPMVLVAAHGPFVWGVTPEKATYHAMMIEELCKTAYLTLQIRPDTPSLSPALIEKHFSRKHGPGAYYGQMSPEDEKSGGGS
jgi:L-ribulose-5-phosphate 4-epimerase